MANQDLTTWTETDGAGVLTVTSAKVTGALQTYTTATYLSKDLGAGYLSGDFTFNFTLYNAIDSANNATVLHYPLIVSNVLAGYQTHINDDNDLMSVGWKQSTGEILLIEWDGATGQSTSYVGADDTIYYCTFRRDESVGTYGTIYLDIYSNSGRTTLLSSLSRLIQGSTKDYRYVQLTVSRDDGTSNSDKRWSGYVEDVDLDATPVATISSVDSPVLDAEAGNSLTTTNYALDIDDVTIQDVTTGNYEIDVSASLSGTSGTFTFDMPDITGYLVDTLGTVFDSASHTHTITAVKGAESDTETIVINPQAGYAVVEVASAVKTEGSVFEGWTGTPANGDQVYYPTASATAVSATGILTTDKVAGTITMFYFDTTDYKWKPFNINLSSPGAGGARAPSRRGFISSCGQLGIK